MTSLSIFLGFFIFESSFQNAGGKYQSRVINNSSTDLLGRSLQWTLTTFREKVHQLFSRDPLSGVRGTELCSHRELNLESPVSPHFFHCIYLIFSRIQRSFDMSLPINNTFAEGLVCCKTKCFQLWFWYMAKKAQWFLLMCITTFD